MIVDVTAEILLGTCKSSKEHYHLVFAYIVIIHQDKPLSHLAPTNFKLLDQFT
jgi:arginyl-tRNA--protein-N-Asp/Glu arginylyltransferase